MSRLRIPTPHGERSYESKSEKPKKVFIIAVEGNTTEIEYFNGIKGNRKPLGIPSVVDIEVLERDDTNSNPKHVVELLEEYINEGYTDVFIENFKEIINKAELGDSAPNVIKKYFAGTLPQRTKEKMEKLIYEADADRIYYKYMENWNVDSKEFCVVFDRDAQSTKPWSFSDIIKSCILKNYTVAITNPCFEFWLLLHLCDVKKEHSSLDEIKQNRRIKNSKKTFVEGELTKKLGSYNKRNIRFKEKFMEHVNTAIKNEKDYATDWKDIVNNVGSNIGALIEEMRKK